MVLQSQIDVLELLLNSNNNNCSEILTPEGEVVGFPGTPRSMMNSELDLDFLDDNAMSMSTVIVDTTEDEYENTFTEEGESPLYSDAFTFQFHKGIVESAGSDQTTCSTSMTSSTSDIFEIDEVPSSFTLQECDDLEEVPLTPLLKEGIKYKIQNRRKAEGKEELTVEFKEPEPEQLTEEEEERRKIRREKNKVAAQKCRGKKRQLADTLQEETEKLESKQVKLQKEIEKLLSEKEHLEDIIKIHSTVCPHFLSS